jgi:hypothetical protein
MNPESGRFVSTDPFSGFKYDPISLHKYLYANAEPVSKIDPSGEMTIAGAMTSISISSILSSLAVSYAIACSSEFILTSMVAMPASSPTFGCRSQGGVMRVQLQVSRSGTTPNTEGIPLSNPTIGVTTLDVRTAMLNLFFSTPLWFPSSLEPALHSAIVGMSIKISKYPPLGVTGHSRNIEREEFPGRKGMLYRIDLEHVRGTNLRF